MDNTNRWLLKRATNPDMRCHVFINGLALDSFDDSYAAACVSRRARRELRKGGWKVLHSCETIQGDNNNDYVIHRITAIKL